MAGSLPDLTLFFERYEQHVREADALFERIRAEFPELVACREQCSSCCHAPFDLSFVEALYLYAEFQKRIPLGNGRAAILDEAYKVDHEATLIKRRLFEESLAGKDNNALLAEMAAETLRCPLLGKDDRCILYEVRPITCRLYGVPAAIGKKSYTCGKTGFVQGNKYPTVALDKMQHRLLALSAELAAFLGEDYVSLASIYVPVSSVLLKGDNASDLGIGGIRRERHL
jgi:Fe-S-cluster containining protein